LSSSSSSPRRDVDDDIDDRFTVRGIFLKGPWGKEVVITLFLRDDDEAEEEAEEGVDGSDCISASLVVVAIISLFLE